MADLLDIAPSTASEAVWIDGQRVAVYGVSIDAIAYLVARFPELRTLVNGGFGDDIVPRMIEFCGRAVGPIIAAGCKHLGEQEYEQHAAQLALEHQAKFVKAIWELTFPNGVGSFITVLTGIMGGNQDAKPKRFRKSRLPSQPSSGTASLQTMQ